MPAFISEPCRGFIYILEPARRGSRKLTASAMPAIVTRDMTAREAGDRLVPLRPARHSPSRQSLFRGAAPMTGEAIIICRVDNFRFGHGLLPWFLLTFVAAVKS
jgi:hypothetical protein